MCRIIGNDSMKVSLGFGHYRVYLSVGYREEFSLEEIWMWSGVVCGRVVDVELEISVCSFLEGELEKFR